MVAPAVGKYFFTLGEHVPIARFPHPELILSPEIKYFRKFSSPTQDALAAAILLQFFENLLLTSTPHDTQKFSQRFAEALAPTRKKCIKPTDPFRKISDFAVPNSARLSSVLSFIDKVGGDGNLSGREQKLAMIDKELQENNVLMDSLTTMLKSMMGTPGNTECAIKQFGEILETTVTLTYLDTACRVKVVLASSQETTTVPTSISLIQLSDSEALYLLYSQEFVSQPRAVNVPEVKPGETRALEEVKVKEPICEPVFSGTSVDELMCMLTAKNGEIDQLKVELQGKDKIIAQLKTEHNAAIASYEASAKKLSEENASLAGTFERFKTESSQQLQAAVTKSDERTQAIMQTLNGLANVLLEVANERSISKADLEPRVEDMADLLYDQKLELEHATKKDTYSTAKDIMRQLRDTPVVRGEVVLSVTAEKKKKSKKPKKKEKHSSSGEEDEKDSGEETKDATTKPYVTKKGSGRLVHKKEECAYCGDQFESDEETKQAECKHKFHVKCFKKLLKQKNGRCPQDEKLVAAASASMTEPEGTRPFRKSKTQKAEKPRRKSSSVSRSGSGSSSDK